MKQSGGVIIRLWYGKDGPEVTTPVFNSNRVELIKLFPFIRKFRDVDTSDPEKLNQYYIDKRVLFTVFNDETPRFFGIAMDYLRTQKELLNDLFDSIKNIPEINETDMEIAKGYVEYDFKRTEVLEDSEEPGFFSIPSDDERRYSGGTPRVPPVLIVGGGKRNKRRTRKMKKSRKVNKRKNRRTRKGGRKHLK